MDTRKKTLDYWCKSCDSPKGKIERGKDDPKTDPEWKPPSDYLKKRVTWSCNLCATGKGAGSASRDKHKAICPNMDVSRYVYNPTKKESKK